MTLKKNIIEKRADTLELGATNPEAAALNSRQDTLRLRMQKAIKQIENDAKQQPRANEIIAQQREALEG